MTTTLDQLKSEIAQITQTVQTHAQDRATLDRDALKAAVADILDKQALEAVERAQKAQPNRKGELVNDLPEQVTIPGMGKVAGFGARSKGVVEHGKFAGAAIDDLVFVHWLLQRTMRLDRTNVRAPSHELDDIVRRALTSTGVGTGDEYVPTGMAAQLWQDMFLKSKVMTTIGVIPMPTDPFDIPLGWGTLTWRKGGQNVAATVTDPATAKSTLTSTEQVAEVNLSYNLDEDAIMAVLPTLRTEITRDGAEQMDKFILNADATDAGTGNINLDDANPADDSYYLSDGQDGLRHLYLVDNTGQSTDVNAALSDAHMRAGIARLGKYASDIGSNKVVAVTDVETYINNMLALSNVVTVDKFGPAATVLTGELAKYSGIPVVVSGAMAEAEDDGKISTTAANNDEGQITFFHKDMWKVGLRRELLIEVDRNIQKRQFIVVVSFRIAVAARGTRSSAVHTSGIHGIVRN